MKSNSGLVLGRLQKLLTASDASATRFDDLPPERLAVERGSAWPALNESPSSAAAMSVIEPLLSETADVAEARIVDRAGHARGAYRGLLWYAAMQAVRASDRVLVGHSAESIARQTSALRDEVDAALRRVEAGSWPASQGDRAAQAAWDILAVFAAGELLHDPVTRWATAAMRSIAARQRPAGGYLLAEGSDNPETLWYHELQIVHAVASLGLQSGDVGLKTSAATVAAWHLNETQPDHATNQPWGLPAFLIDPATHVMADGLLHAATAQESAAREGGGVSGVSLILIADALYSFRRRS